MNNNFKKRLIEVRKAFKLSGYAFAKKLNIPQPTYLRYETGEQKPSAKLIEALVMVCNINAQWLFSGQGLMFYNPNFNTGERIFDTKQKEKIANFGKKLSELQSKHNFLDREMATILGINEKSYLSMVTGLTLPNTEILNNLKKNFNVSIDYMLYED